MVPQPPQVVPEPPHGGDGGRQSSREVPGHPRGAHGRDDAAGDRARGGHALGLPHNWIASAAFPVDSLRSPTFTERYGVAASIMEYARQNYIAQPGDGVTRFVRKIGPYDHYAINWGYRVIPDAKTAEDEVPCSIAGSWSARGTPCTASVPSARTSARRSRPRTWGTTPCARVGTGSPTSSACCRTCPRGLRRPARTTPTSRSSTAS